MDTAIWIGIGLALPAIFLGTRGTLRRRRDPIQIEPPDVPRWRVERVRDLIIAALSVAPFLAETDRVRIVQLGRGVEIRIVAALPTGGQYRVLQGRGPRVVVTAGGPFDARLAIALGHAFRYCLRGVPDPGEKDRVWFATIRRAIRLPDEAPE